MNFPRFSQNWILCVVWVLIIGIGSIFCWERVLYQDSAYALFKVLNLQNTIEHGRFIVPFILWIGYLASCLSLPISFVVWGISMGNLFWGLLLTIYFYKSTKNSLWTWGPAIILLGTGPDFYFLGISEMITALLFALTCSFFLIYEKKISVFFLIIAFFAHPGTLPAIIFLFAFLLIQHAQNRVLWLNIVTFAVVASLKVFIFTNSEYEQGIIKQIDIKDITDFLNSWGFEYFMSSLIDWLLPVLILVVASVAVSRMSLKKILQLLSFSCVAVFIVFVYRNGDSYMMMQKSFAPLMLMSFWTFIFQEFPAKRKEWMLVICSSICLLGVFYRINEGEFYRNRMKKLDKIIQLAGPGKFLTVSATFPAEDYRVNWAIPYESFVRSASQNGPKRTTTFSFIDSTELKSISGNSSEHKIGEGQFKGANFAYPMSHTKLRKQYFDIDSASCYKVYNNTKKAP